MRRIEWLDFGKGFTILFVVIAHVLEGLYLSGNYASDREFFQITLGLVFTFIMPVFFALSGYLYKKITDWHDFGQMLYKKLVALGIPYVFFSILYVFLQHFSSGVNNAYSWTNLLYIWRDPVSYLWFLYDLFFIFVFLGLLDLIFKDDRVIAGIVVICFLLGLFLPLGWINGTFIWGLPFYLGRVFRLHGKLLDQKWLLGLSLVVLVVSLFIQYNSMDNFYLTNGFTLKTTISKIASVIVFFYLFKHLSSGNTVFRKFSDYGLTSMTIYMVHGPVLSALRIILFRFGLTNVILQIILGLLITWFVSTIVMNWLSDHLKIVQFLLYPRQILDKYVLKSSH